MWRRCSIKRINSSFLSIQNHFPSQTCIIRRLHSTYKKSFTNHRNKHKYITPIEHVFCLWCFWKEGWSFCQIVIKPGCFQFQIFIKHEFDGSTIRRYWVIIWVTIFVGLLIALSFFYCHGNSFRANVLNQHFSLVHIGHIL